MKEKHNIMYYLDSNTLSLELQQLFQFLDFFKNSGWNRKRICQASFFSWNQILKMIILRVTIKVDQGASTFWMHGPLRVKKKIE